MKLHVVEAHKGPLHMPIWCSYNFRFKLVLMTNKDLDIVLVFTFENVSFNNFHTTWEIKISDILCRVKLLRRIIDIV